MIGFLADYYQNIEIYIYPVRRQVEPDYLGERLPEFAPLKHKTIETILKIVQKDIIPGIAHWRNPNFISHFPSSGSIAVDPLGPPCDVAKEYGIWVHVDAAYAGGACILSEFGHFLDDVEGANSLKFNSHKWFFTTLDCCVCH
ncbi:hypothetical protein RJ640_024836 [Escallonia rubra]|uniref:Uncharacterized protein n=1 Tax=Escallonia rubra TaxID=112253 RepID=A0AA88UG14_9ASTE|nr:hypothetical protein RJ640_024836 [Escallonia rubra]